MKLKKGVKLKSGVRLQAKKKEEINTKKDYPKSNRKYYAMKSK